MKWITLSFFLLLTACRPSPPAPAHHTSGAGHALAWWTLARTYPDGRLHTDRWYAAFREINSGVARRDESPRWTSLGPRNIGGRTLCLAFHPGNPDILYAGSASGGLWRSSTAGRGPRAWEPVPTGFPVLAVGAIAIDPTDPRILYIGAGEVYNYAAAQPGIADRFTRGAYGIGILKSTDGGRSWRPALDWSLTDRRGVWDIALNPANPRTVFAATTDGVFRSYDGGRSWQRIHDRPMAMDLELDPRDTARLYVAHGSLNSPERGLYRSRDGGRSFERLPGLPTDFTGKMSLAVSPSDPAVLYASVANATASVGLFRSGDGGDSWALVNDADVAQWQGWYSHELAVHPTDPETVVYAGIDAHRSGDGGRTLRQLSYWAKWSLGVTTPAGEHDGAPDYAHSDIHGVYFHPGDPNTIFLATDGGVYASEDGGNTWAARNGGYQTTQFYPNFASSPHDSTLAIGGLQDNATVIYAGAPDWSRHIGGDGNSAAAHLVDENVLFASSQFLSLWRSDDRGKSFWRLSLASARGEQRAFNAPYELSPPHPDVVFAGAERLHVSRDRGRTWQATTAAPVDGGNPILTIAVHPVDDRRLLIGTAPLSRRPALVLRSSDGGRQWTPVSGLPDRLVTDLDFHPARPDTAYATVAGFGTPHLYHSTDGGASWRPLDRDLPDVPANAVAVDPLNPGHLYLGNDLGVFASFDGGDTWRPYLHGLPEATLVMDLSVSPANRRLRAATHGRGVYEVALLPPGEEPEPPGEEVLTLRVFPNPARTTVTFELDFSGPASFSLLLYNAKGQLVRTLENRRHVNGSHTQSFPVGDLPAGVYIYSLRGYLDGSGGEVNRQGRIVK